MLSYHHLPCVYDVHIYVNKISENGALTGLHFILLKANSICDDAIEEQLLMNSYYSLPQDIYTAQLTIFNKNNGIHMGEVHLIYERIIPRYFH